MGTRLLPLHDLLLHHMIAIASFRLMHVLSLLRYMECVLHCLFNVLSGERGIGTC